MPDKKGSDDRAYARGFAAGRAAATPDPPDDREGLIAAEFFAAGLRAASPDERLREPTDTFCDRLIDEIIVKLGGKRGFTSDRFPLARWDMKACLLAAADREAPDGCARCSVLGLDGCGLCAPAVPDDQEETT